MTKCEQHKIHGHRSDVLMMSLVTQVKGVVVVSHGALRMLKVQNLETLPFPSCAAFCHPLHSYIINAFVFFFLFFFVN